MSKKHYGGDLKGKVFCIWGLSFKPQTDDMREAPSLILIEALHEAGAKIQAYDPVAMKEAKHLLGDQVQLKEDAMSATEKADALILVTEWPEFRLPDWNTIIKKMNGQVIFDGRNIYNRKEMKKFGFIYYGIGRGKV